MTRLLLVDDNPGDIDLFRLAAEEAGWGADIHVARDGLEAILLLEQPSAWPDGRPHLAVIDLNMPRMDGWQLLESLRASSTYRNVRRIVMSTSLRPTDCDRAIDLGAERCIAKPSSFDGLIDVIGALRREFGSDRHPAVPPSAS